MATLDEFVKTLREADQLQGDFEEDFRLSGGQVVQITPNEDYKFFGLGIFNSILEYYDAPVKSDQSRNFQMLIDVNPHSHDIFREHPLNMAISGGLISVTPVLPEAYDSMKNLTQRLYHNFEAFRLGLDPKKRNDKGIGEIKEKIQGISKAKNARDFMQKIFNSSRELGFEICGCLPSWINDIWSLKMPIEYQALERVFEQFKEECRETKYQISVSDDIKSHEYIKVVDVDCVPARFGHLWLTSTPLELKAAESLKGYEDRNILYTGPVSDELLGTLRPLRKNNHVVCDSKIKGTNQYRAYVESMAE